MSDNASKYDELREMARLAEEMGDEFPTAPETEQVNTPQPAANEQQVDQVRAVDTGMDQYDAPEADGLMMDGQISIDAVLGLKPKSAPVPEPKADDTAPAAPAAAPDHQPTAMEARLAEMAAEIRSLRENNDALTRRALNADQPPKAEGTTEAFERNPEVLEYLKNYGVVTADDLATIRAAVEPLRQQAEDQEIAAFVSQHVDGFKAEHMPALYKAVKEMSDTDKAHYAGVQGAALLAASLVKRGALDLGKRKHTEEPNPMLRRMHTEAAGGRPDLSDAAEEMAKVKALMDMPEDQFLRMLNQLPS